MSDPIQFHPASEIFELLEGTDFDALVIDIQKQGLLSWIWLHPDGSILDGRNRYLACKAAGVEPKFQTWIGQGSAADFVWSLNFTRRHLEGNARKMAAAKYAIELEREAKERQGTRTDLGTSSQICGKVEFARSSEIAAEKFNEGVRSVQSAVAVVKHAIPELVEKVERGHVSVSAAADVARLPKPEQREIVAAGPKAVVAVASDIRKNGMAHRTNFTGNNQWFTPPQYIEMARDVLGNIDLDPASHTVAQETVKAARFFTQEDDGLKQKWEGRIWLNPPYSQPEIARFIDKLTSEYFSGDVREGILLTNNCTDAKWFHTAIGAARRVCFTKGRISFKSPAGAAGAPVQGQSFFYFGDNVERFESVFSAIGSVVEPKTGGGP